MYGKSVLFSQVAIANICSVRFYKKDSTKKLLEFLADMPKANSSKIAEAQRQRHNISKKSEKYGPSTVYLQVLGSGANGAPNTLYLFTDQKRYLFNCGECTQRLAHEHKVKLSRLDHIFITSKTWRNIGGLPGLSLTLQDVGVPNITLHGPDGLDELYNATKRFVIMKDMNVTMAKCSPCEDFEDNAMSVKYVLLGPLDDILVKEPKQAAKRPRFSDSTHRDLEEFINDDTDYYKPEIRHMEASSKSAPETKKYVKERVVNKQKIPIEKAPDPMKKKTEKVLQDLQKKSHCSVAYICTLKKRMGTLDLAKCVELGVKPGPMLGQLKSGHDVVLPDGTLVLSKDVKTPDSHGPVFIVLDVPDLSDLKETEFSAHFDNGLNPPENIPTLIVHYTPPHVFHNPAYQAFMTLFGPTVRHLILNSQNSCLGSEAVHRTQHKLHLLDPDIFPLLRDVSVPAVWNAHPPLPKTNSPIRLKGLEELKTKIALAQFQNIINMESSCKGDCRPNQGVEDQAIDKMEFLEGRTLTMFHLRPKKQLDRSAEPKLHIQDYIQETMDVDGFVPSLEQFRRLVDSMRYARSGTQKEYPKVVFLGTGSCIPSKTRNTSAIVIHIDENRTMLLDCGEGTFGQLVRFYGPKRVNSILRTLKGIYVSHLHADHHIGLIGVLQARRRAFEELDKSEPPDPIHLLAPGQIVSWLSIYDQQFEKIKEDYTLIPNQSLAMSSPHQNGEMTSAILAHMGIRNIQTCFVSHCPNAFGVSIEVDQYKITYSGDTIPCEALVKCGQDSTLLIHEATMEDELAEEARAKMHSTTTQAIEIGRKMNARYTVLTHFSQRYARLPRLNANILNDNNSVGIAFDNMQITMSDLELLPHMYAPLQLMFAEHCVELELKAAHRARNKERRLSYTELGDKSCKPPCRSALSSPLSRSPARYRESNSSRLRAEITGMTMSGTMRPLRSKSSSPAKSFSPSRTPLSGRSTPRPRSPEKHVDIITAPPTVSTTSTISRDIEVKTPSNVSSGLVVDTRSKTINSVSSRLTSEDIREPVSLSSKKITNSGVVNDCKGYGKPLVTPINKRLTLRRDISKPTSLSINMETVSPIVRCKSPMKRKAENRQSSSPPAADKCNLSKTKLPEKIRCPSPTSADKKNISKTKLPTKRSESGNQLRASTSANVKTSDYQKLRSPAIDKGIKGSTSSEARRSTSPVRQVRPATGKLGEAARSVKPSRIRPPMVRKPYANINEGIIPPVSGAPAPSPMKPPWNNSISTELQKKKSLPSLREALNDNLRKQEFKPISVMGRPSATNHSIRSFMPQLEDIKSSFILLNKKTYDRKDNVTNKGPPLPRPKAVNEKERNEQLKEVKTKFRSRGFFHDSKYDKIEGLNWITWK